MILVTGGTGLVGSHLLYHLLLENNTVRAIYREQESLNAVKKVFSYYTDNVASLFSKIQWVKADITDIISLEEAFIDVKFVYHIAAVVSFDLKDYKKMRQVNIYGTANIVNFCIDKKVTKLCFVSSIATTGESLNSDKITEENEWNTEDNNSRYSITKHGAEMEVWRASQEGVDVIIVNPGVILGAGFWTVNTGKLFTQMHKGFSLYTEGITGFISVTDVVNSMIKLMKSTIKNERFILVSENISFKELSSSIAENFGKKKPSVRITKLATSIFWRIDFVVSIFTGKKRFLTKEIAKSLHKKSYYSSKKIKISIGYKFKPLKDVVKEICKLYPIK